MSIREDSWLQNLGNPVNLVKILTVKNSENQCPKFLSSPSNFYLLNSKFLKISGPPTPRRKFPLFTFCQKYANIDRNCQKSKSKTCQKHVKSGPFPVKSDPKVVHFLSKPDHFLTKIGQNRRNFRPYQDITCPLLPPPISISFPHSSLLISTGHSGRALRNIRP